MSKNDYKIVQRDLAVRRMDRVDSPLANSVSMDWIVDTSRRVNHPKSFESVSDALEFLSRAYRKNLWVDADCVVQVWLEKDALTGVLEPITHKYDVPLIVARGFSSLGQLHEAAVSMTREAVSDLRGEKRPVHVYHFGDHDYYGCKARNAIKATLNELTPDDVKIIFNSVAVSEAQIKKWKLPKRDANLNPNNTPAGATMEMEWGDKPTVELDAIAPNKLRDLLERCLTKHMPPERLKALNGDEAFERDEIRNLVGR